MNGESVCEVMLRAYKDIDAMLEKLEERSLQVGLRSINIDVWEAIKKIERINSEMTAYCIVQDIVEQALQDSKELEDYYFRGKQFCEIAKAEKMPERKVQYKIEKQRAQFYKNVLDRYSKAELVNIISPSKWLINMYNRRIKQADSDKRVHKVYITIPKYKTAQNGK